MQHHGAISLWIGMGWDGSLGGVRYRAPFTSAVIDRIQAHEKLQTERGKFIKEPAQRGKFKYVLTS